MPSLLWRTTGEQGMNRDTVVITTKMYSHSRNVPLKNHINDQVGIKNNKREIGS